MSAGLLVGDFAHVAGTFDLSSGEGTIDYVTPVRTATRSADVDDEGLRLVGTDGAGRELFDITVNPQRNSCAPHGDRGTFDDYVPVSPELRHLRLLIGGKPAADFARGAPASQSAIALGGLDLSAPHRFSLAADAPPAVSPGVSYTVQAKDAQSTTWQTIAVGLPMPATDVDANQFPGAKSVSVRVLRSDGFSESEVFNDTKHLTGAVQSKTPVFRYDPPSNVDDLAGRSSRQAFLDAWHDFIAEEVAHNIAMLRSPVDDHGVLADTPIPQPLFFSEVDTAAVSADVPVPWNAFPLAITRAFGTDRPAAWASAEKTRTTTDHTPPDATPVTTKFRPQDEYCEWHVYRDKSTKAISRVAFTSEGPEYWIKLAEHDFDWVVELYRNLVSPKVVKDDLKLTRDIAFGPDVLKKGSYDPFNVWNTEEGVMHLTHRANTLGAEINLAARATAMRHDSDGVRITETRRLICCSGYGSANRSSDPTIGQAVNITALGTQPGDTPQAITLANPVALYMDSLEPGTLASDAGDPMDDWFRFVRGVKGRGLMAVVEPPAGQPPDFARLRVKGAEFSLGGQIAEAIGMVLYARTAPFAGARPPFAACVSHCCVKADLPPGKVKDANFEQGAATESCGGGLSEAFAELVGPPSPAGFAPTRRAGPIWRRTRLGIAQ